MIQSFVDWTKKIRRQTKGRLPKSRATIRHAGGGGQTTFVGGSRRFSRLSMVKQASILEDFQDVDPRKFVCKEYRNNGNYTVEAKGKVSNLQGSIPEAVALFRAKPEQFVSLFFPTEALQWPEGEQIYTLVHRAGTVGFQPRNVNPNGRLTMYVHEFQPLPAFSKDELPSPFQDRYTDTVLTTFRGRRLGTPLLPGRGMGLVDQPTISFMDRNADHPDPSCVKQGHVGDCWLLSGIAALAEFDGAIRHLFRKTPNMDQMPFEDGRPNLYTVSLWDLTSWREVDIVVDERLCADPGDQHAHLRLHGARPSKDNELWTCYLEKAIAAHCGGWDKIDGGFVTHAWSLLTGNKEQYIIQKSKSGKFGCWAKYNTASKQWAHLSNSPTEGPQGQSNVAWPKVGAVAGKQDSDLTPDELFARMCAWDDENYLIGCASGGTSDRLRSHGGIVDNHAYCVVQVRNDVAGTGVDMIQVRNPWGKGAAEKGKFRDKGPGWKKYPTIKSELNPVAADADDGLFWVTKEEFFKYYEVVYLSAFNMTTFFGAKRSSKKAATTQPASENAAQVATTAQAATTPQVEQPAQQQQQQPSKVLVTFANTRQDPAFATAELYYESTRFGPLGQGNPPIAVESYPGHRWFLVANGVYAKQFDVGLPAQQVFEF